MLTVTALPDTAHGVVILRAYDDEIGLVCEAQVSPMRALELAAQLECGHSARMVSDQDICSVTLGDDKRGLRVIAKLDNGNVYDERVTDSVDLSNLASLINVQCVMERRWPDLSSPLAVDSVLRDTFYHEYHACKPHADGSFAVAEVHVVPMQGVKTCITMRHPSRNANDDLDYNDVMELAAQLPPIVRRAEETFASTTAPEKEA